MTVVSSLARRSVLVVIAGMIGCAGSSEYVYTPDTANATAAGMPASRTPIPQEQPQGAVEVKSYGITHLQQLGDVPVLLVRMTVTNDGDAVPWQVDTREQYVSIPGEGRSRAMYARSDVQTLPVVQIPQRTRHVFDLYFPLPDTVDRASRLPRFDVQWQVQTAARLVASSTGFDRVRSDPDRYAYDPWWPYGGFGPYWWYDPFYPSVAFVHAPIYVHGHHHHR